MTFYTLGKRSDLPRIISDCPRPTQDPQNLSVPDLAPAKHKFQNGRQEAGHLHDPGLQNQPAVHLIHASITK